MTMLERVSKQWFRRIVFLASGQKRELQPENILARYHSGQYYMIDRYGRMKWKNPEQRAVIPLDDRFRVGKRLAKKIHSGHFEVTFDRVLRRVVESCAELNPKRSWTWIYPEVIDVICRLHQQGYAHSVEVWRQGQLVGGEYGIAIGGFYSGESMFAREDYASRVALVFLVNRLRDCGYTLLDTQELRGVVREFGAYEIPREEYLSLLGKALSQNVSSFSSNTAGQ
jgi:leucyl/phenylalanyl-tRNA--protein transferase